MISRCAGPGQSPKGNDTIARAGRSTAAVMLDPLRQTHRIRGRTGSRVHRYVSPVATFWIVQHPGGDDWWLGTDRGNGHLILLGSYRTAQAAAAAVGAGLTGWAVWDRGPWSHNAPDLLEGWTKDANGNDE